MRRWITIMLPLVVLAAAVYMRVESPVIVHELRLKVFDAYPVSYTHLTLPTSDLV